MEAVVSVCLDSFTDRGIRLFVAKKGADKDYVS